ncbi:MAG: hypothetical protein J3Q66DRAFT_391603 [Benniella sp.]|nr:MAG: hypothetical protein J3Q66DRAFT_391603 [Benniella sp.]
MNRSSINLSRPSQEKGHAASGDLFLSPTSEPYPPERAASTDQCLANLSDHQDATDNTLPQPILPSQQHLYNVWPGQVQEPLWIAYQHEQGQQMQLQQRVIHQDTPYILYQPLSSGAFGLQLTEQPLECEQCEQYFESQLTWTPMTPEERQMVNLMSTTGPGSFPWFRDNLGYGLHIHLNGGRSRDQDERRDRPEPGGKAKSKGHRKNKKATPETKRAIVEYKQNNPDSSFREIAEKFKLAKTTAHRIISKMRPNKQPRGQTSATSRSWTSTILRSL